MIDAMDLDEGADGCGVVTHAAGIGLESKSRETTHLLQRE